MSFGNNVSYYRSKKGITQEELAEKLNVSRQTVSRWETDSAFPEMEKVIILCDLFNCDMETLVRGDALNASDEEKITKLSTYNKHMNRFTICITLGVFLILLGLMILLTFQAFNIEESLGIIIFLSFIATSIAIFIISGIMHSNFRNENPKVEYYSEEKIKKFNHLKPFLLSLGVVLILLGVIVLIFLTSFDKLIPSNFSKENWDTLSTAIFFVFINFGVSLFVFTGMQIEKFEVKKYNKENKLDIEVDSKKAKHKSIADAICGVIMLIATIIYLLLGFLGNYWHPGWIVFPVGGILCGIISTIFTAIDQNK